MFGTSNRSELISELFASCLYFFFNSLQVLDECCHMLSICHGVSLGRFWEYNNFHLCIGLLLLTAAGWFIRAIAAVVVAVAVVVGGRDTQPGLTTLQLIIATFCKQHGY